MSSKKRSGYGVKAAIIVTLLAASLFISYKALTHMYPVEYADYIREYSTRYDMDPYLVLAVIRVESDFNPKAVSSRNAMGLMQITESTGKWGARVLMLTNYGNDSLLEPETNIALGCWYLDVLRKEFGDDRDLILAAYNAGSGNVKLWLKDKSLSPSGKSLDKIPFSETENYLKKVNNCYKIYKRLYENIF